MLRRARAHDDLRRAHVLVTQEQRLDLLLHCIPLLFWNWLIKQLLSVAVPRHQGDEDGNDVTLQIEEALGEGCGGDLTPALLGGVDLEVVPKRRVQPQQARGVIGVEVVTQAVAQLRCLLHAAHGELPAPFRHHQDHSGLSRRAFLRGLPLRSLQLHLPLKTGEAVLHLQNRDQEVNIQEFLLQSRQAVVAFLACFDTAVAAVAEQPRDGHVGLHQGVDLFPDVLGDALHVAFQLLHRLRGLQLHLGGVRLSVVEVGQDCGVLCLKLHLLLGPSVAMAHDDDHRAQSFRA
mmetsp:Transcript_137803/g.294485  ORF Transcript_137803/g.294485 Transcript_137803/m.294485 type:complete len:290 (+) Transcript_137803:2121-2990(+)